MKVNSEIINSVDRALDILILFYQEKRELGITEISSNLGLHKGTVYRTIHTLQNKGFVQQNTENGKYWLGLRAYAVGMIAGEKMPLKQIIQPYAKKLSEKFNEVVNVSVLDTTSEKYPRSMLILKEESGTQMLKISPGVGSSSKCYCAGVGKVLLAYSPEEIFDKCKEEDFSSFTDNTIKTWEQLLNQLQDIRIKGYAIDNEEQEIGLTCIAAPILDKNNKAIAAISISGPTTRIKSTNFEETVNEVKNTAAQISNLLI